MLVRMMCYVVGLYLAAMACLYVIQDDQLFAKMWVVKEQNMESDTIKALSFDVEGATLKGLYRKEGENAPLLLYFGGNAEDARAFVRATRSLNGYDIVTLNYRGYVDSSGKPSEKALYADALAQYDAFGKGKEVIVVGRSLGTGIATYVASQREVKGLVLITPYDSILSIAKQMYPYFPIDMLLKHPFESVKYIPHVKAPISIFEVENDTMIPKVHLEALMAKIPTPFLHVTFTNTTHNHVFGHPKFIQELQTTLGKIRE